MEFAFSQGLSKGLGGLGQALANASAVRRQYGAQELDQLVGAELKAGQAQKVGAESLLAQELLKRTQRRDADLEEAAAASSGLTLPEYRGLREYQRTGQSPTMSVPDVGAMTGSLDEQDPQRRDEPRYSWQSNPLLMNAGRRALAATQLGGQMKDIDPRNITQAQGELQQQDTSGLALGALAGGNVEGASALNQIAKPGQQIKLRDNIASTGATFSPATGTVSTNNPLAASTIAENNAKANKTATGTETSWQHFTDADGKTFAFNPKTLETRPVTDPTGAQFRQTPPKQQEQIDRKVLQFSTELQKTNIPGFEESLQNLENLMAKFKGGDIPGIGGTGNFPQWLLSDDGKQVRQALSMIKNIELKDRSGAAVTDSELRRFVEEMGGTFTSDDQIRTAIQNVRNRFNAVRQNIIAGVGDDVLQEYAARGGIPIVRGQQPKIPTGAPGTAAPTPRQPAQPGAAPQSDRPAVSLGTINIGGRELPIVRYDNDRNRTPIVSDGGREFRAVRKGGGGV